MMCQRSNPTLSKLNGDVKKLIAPFMPLTGRRNGSAKHQIFDFFGRDSITIAPGWNDWQFIA